MMRLMLFIIYRYGFPTSNASPLGNIFHTRLINFSLNRKKRQVSGRGVGDAVILRYIYYGRENSIYNFEKPTRGF